MISVVLAAGKGTRMKSNFSKLVHKVNGKPMINKVYETLMSLDIKHNIFVLGYQKEQVIETLGNVEYVIQENQLGTAHCLMIAKDKISEYREDILVCNGDGPLLTKDTILEMKKYFVEKNLDLLILSCDLEKPYGYGRIIKDNNKVLDICEESEASETQKLINEINTGVYLFKFEAFMKIIDEFDNNNSKKEYFITDSVKLMNKHNLNVETFKLKNKDEMLGVNSKAQLAEVSKILRKRKNEELMRDGVILIDPDNTYIEEDVKIGKDSIIYPNVYISKNTIIGENCIIYSNSRIEDTIIGDNVIIDSSIIKNSNIENGVNIGPFAHIRPDSILKEKSKVGNFVEIKKSILENNVKCGHLSYIGDTIVGENSNIGAGCITCNYDGKKKHKTIIGKNSFIGSNSIMVAPLNIGQNVLTAAGSVFTKDIPDNNISFGRAKQVNKEKK